MPPKRRKKRPPLPPSSASIPSSSYSVMPLTENLVKAVERKCAKAVNLPADCRPEWRDNFSPESVYKACYICEETLVGLHVLTKHLRMHGEGRFPCPSCGKDGNLLNSCHICFIQVIELQV